MAQCGDCRGSGQYIGLNVIEDCRTCGGSGTVPDAGSAVAWKPPGELAVLLRRLKRAYKSGNINMAEERLMMLFDYVQEHDDVWPPHVTQDDVLEFVSAEAERVGDISSAVPGRRAGLLQGGWKGKPFGLDIDVA